MQTIYFDNNATTPIDPAVREAMLPYLDHCFGNPASEHHVGEAAKAGLLKSRTQVAGLLGCDPGRIVFTSGGTEANNLAIWSALRAKPQRRHLIASTVEHASILNPLSFWASQGYELELLGVDRDGGLDLEALKRAIRPDTALVCLMAANNETGVLWPMAEISAICREQGALLLCDAIQLAGKAALPVEQLGVDYLTIASHKLHGPKGAGALYARQGVPLFPQIMGSDQEWGLRAGTENLPGIVGFGQACALATVLEEQDHQRMAGLRDRLEQGLLAAIPEAIINGSRQPRLVNTCNIGFRNVSAVGLIQDLDALGIAVSAHVASKSGDLDPSHVLHAMAIPDEFLHGVLRLSLSRFTTEAEVERLLAVLPGLVARARQDFAV